MRPRRRRRGGDPLPPPVLFSRPLRRRSSYFFLTWSPHALLNNPSSTTRQLCFSLVLSRVAGGGQTHSAPSGPSHVSHPPLASGVEEKLAIKQNHGTKEEKARTFTSITDRSTNGIVNYGTGDASSQRPWMHSRIEALRDHKLPRPVRPIPVTAGTYR